MRKNIGQRNDQDDFSEKAEEDSSFLLIQRLKDRLSAVLKRLKNKRKKIQMQSTGSILHNGRISTENPDKPDWPNQNQKPDQKGVRYSQGHHDTNRLLDIVRSFRPVIVTDSRRSSLGHREYRCVKNRSDRRNNRHYGNIHRPAELHEDLITCNLHQRVCKLHDKRRGSETDDLSRMRES